MTQKDFKVKNGIIAGGNITSSNSGFIFDATANTLSIGGNLVASATSVNTVQSNVTSILTGTTLFTGNKTFSNSVTVNGNLVLTAVSANGSLGTAGQVLASNATAVYWTTVDTGGSASVVQSNLNTVSTNVNSIAANVSTLTTNLGTVSSNLNTLTTAVGTVSSNVNTLGTRINTVQSNVATVSSNLNALTTSVGTISSNLNTVTTTVAAQTSSINNVQSNLTAYIATANLHTITSVGGITTNSVQVGALKATSGEFVGNLTITGNLFVSSNTFLVSANNLSLEDNMIYLNANNKVANPDLGIAGNYNDGTYRHAGMFRDASDGNWKFFDSYLPEPDASPTIDTANASFRLANVSANTIIITGGIYAGGTYGTAGQALLSTGTTSAWTTIANAAVVQANLNTVSTNVNSIASNVTTLTTNLGTVSSNVNTVTTNLGTVSSNLNTLTTSVGTISTNVNSIAANVSTLTTNLGTVSSNVNTVTTNLGTVSTNVNSIAANVVNIINGSSPFTGNISAPRIILNTQLQIGSNATTSVGTSATNVFVFPGSTYRGVDLTLLVQDVTNSQYQLSKMMIVHNGTVVDWTEYAMISTNNSDLTGFSATIDAGANVAVVSTGGSANKKITVSAQYILQ